MRTINRITALGFLVFAALAAWSPAQAQFTQQGPKLVGTGGVVAKQGISIALSGDGNTAIIGGRFDNSDAGAAWVFSRSGGVWSQQGAKLVGSGAVGNAQQGASVALSFDGNTAIVGGFSDNSAAGAAWVFTRSGGVWSQQGAKLLGTGASGNAAQGSSVMLSADGNTAILGGPGDGANAGAAWVFTRSGGVWSQQDGKLVGTGASGVATQGISVALSADGNTAILGGNTDDAFVGAAWVFTRSGASWTQQGAKLVGTGASGNAGQGASVALSADGNTAMIGGPHDNSEAGAAWVFSRSGSTWTQQGAKLVGTGASGNAQQNSVALSADGNIAILGGYLDDSFAGAVWVFTRAGATWTQQGSKLVGTGASGVAGQGFSVALSADGNTAIFGGVFDDSQAGAAWVFTQPGLGLSGASNVVATGNAGGPFLAPSFDYVLSAPGSAIGYAISGVPDWLTAPPAASGALSAGGQKTITFTVNAHSKPVGTLGPNTISFTNTTNARGNTSITATLNVGTPGPVRVVSAVLPASRSVQVGNIATAFATIINTANSTGTNCGLGQGSGIPAAFHFQTTDPATNALTGTLNAGVNIPAGGAQSYVFAIQPTGTFSPTEVMIDAGCSNGAAATSVVGLNTLLLSASASPVPDIVALAATAGNNGIVDVAGGAGAFAVATANVGIAAAITVSADTGSASLPVSVTLCQTNPGSGQCTSAIGPAVTTNVLANGTPTFGIFVQGTDALVQGTVPFDPTHNRIFVRFKDSGGVTRGATSVAVRTQ